MTESQSSNRFGPLSTYQVTLPDHLIIRPTRGNLLTEFSTYGYDGKQFFGVAFIQGKRLQFSTAMPLNDVLTIAKIDRANRGSGVDELMNRANRPKVAGHAKALRQYFKDTACIGEKFILPAFAFNFGDEMTTKEDAPDAVLYIYAHENENSTNGWTGASPTPHRACGGHHRWRASPWRGGSHYQRRGRVHRRGAHEESPARTLAT